MNTDMIDQAKPTQSRSESRRRPGAPSGAGPHKQLPKQAEVPSRLFKIRETWVKIVDRRAGVSTACIQNLSPMVTQAMRSVAKTAGKCWAIPNWRPDSAASLLRILAPVTGRGDMIVLLRPYGGHGWQCAGLRVYGTVGDHTGVEADAGAATAGAVWTVLLVKNCTRRCGLCDNCWGAARRRGRGLAPMLPPLPRVRPGWA